jgi:acyl-CoA reductase-like NAD-dependent aldehyde dehydrogenase
LSDYRLLIGGQLVSGDLSMPVVNPATGQVFAEAPRASRAQLDAAVAAAAKAFPAWAATPLEDRRALLVAIADRVDAHAGELAPLLVREHGMPLANARIEIMVFGLKLRAFAQAALPGGVIDLGDGRRVEQRYRPLGVVAAIVPWNLPLILLSTKLAPALLMGDTVVAKPAATTSLTTLRLGELIADLVPPGVLNVIADANDLGDALTSHPDVRMVTFTGSTAVGRKVVAASAAGLKRFTLELGGNDPAIVLDDADPVATAAILFEGAFQNSGQACIAVKRVYVQSGVYKPLCEALTALAKAAKVGDGFAEGVQFGPVQNRAQFERVQGIIADAAAQGGVLTGGAAPGGGGYFIAQTIVTNLAEGTRLVDEEQFGPVLPVLEFADVDDAIARANATPYGLAASVFSPDVAKARAIAARLEAGTVTVNKLIEFDTRVPFGGAKASGFGVENTEIGLAEFGQIQVLDMAGG